MAVILQQTYSGVLPITTWKQQNTQAHRNGVGACTKLLHTCNCLRKSSNFCCKAFACSNRALPVQSLLMAQAGGCSSKKHFTSVKIALHGSGIPINAFKLSGAWPMHFYQCLPAQWCMAQPMLSMPTCILATHVQFCNKQYGLQISPEGCQHSLQLAQNSSIHCCLCQYAVHP